MTRCRKGHPRTKSPRSREWFRAGIGERDCGNEQGGIKKLFSCLGNRYLRIGWATVVNESRWAFGAVARNLCSTGSGNKKTTNVATEKVFDHCLWTGRLIVWKIGRHILMALVKDQAIMDLERSTCLVCPFAQWLLGPNNSRSDQYAMMILYEKREGCWNLLGIDRRPLDHRGPCKHLHRYRGIITSHGAATPCRHSLSVSAVSLSTCPLLWLCSWGLLLPFFLIFWGPKITRWSLSYLARAAHSRDKLWSEIVNMGLKVTR